MSFHLIGLGKLLNAMYASDAQRTTLLRTDIRSGIKKASGSSTEKGGDFYGPFWADAKRHVAGELDLRTVTSQRAAGNKTRERLYPLLCDGFLLWWEEKRRLRNVPFSVINTSVKARYDALGLGTVKVENTLSFTVGEDGHRILYPYFCEDPALSDEAARLGLWAMSQCIKGYALKDLRLLDVLEGRSFSVLDTPLIGNEETFFLQKYAFVLEEWQKLRAEYP
ncbi:hypothetical protein [Phenylobacterium sp.]|uniref:hypothetical protein n=1 Tax=Phenylobacterium sp. TaxID=1871053 RepID=UPI003BA9B065